MQMTESIAMHAGDFLVRIVDDDAMFCDAVSLMLSSEGWHVKTYMSAETFLREDMPSWPGVVVLDINMPDMDGIALQKELLKRNYIQPIVFLTAHGTIDAAVDVLRDGAFHFLQKPVDPARLLKVIAMAYELVQERNASSISIQDALMRFERMTDREREVAELLTQGLLNSDIAKRLHLSIRTVQVHRAHVYEKLQVKSVAEVAQVVTLVLKKAAQKNESKP